MNQSFNSCIDCWETHGLLTWKVYRWLASKWNNQFQLIQFSPSESEFLSSFFSSYFSFHNLFILIRSYSRSFPIPFRLFKFDLAVWANLVFIFPKHSLFVKTKSSPTHFIRPKTPIHSHFNRFCLLGVQKKNILFFLNLKNNLKFSFVHK